ncbi:MAG: hypothetical protein M1814_003776 [Vezdaea aestivalis]|nr:MAG: hypothetical protein M1814_003776 [Vezdaea aestivalis]
MPFLEQQVSALETFKWFDNVVFSLDILASPTSKSVGSVPKAKTFEHDLLHSTHWHDYERGTTTESQCINALAKELQVPAEIVLTCIVKITRQDIPEEVSQLMNRLKDTHKIYFAGNSPSKFGLDLDSNSQLHLDGAFVSSELGERLPHPGFFSLLFAQSPSLRQRTVFVTTKADNVISARSSGLYAILVADAQDALQRLTTLCADPIPSTLSYLAENAGKHHLDTNLGYVIQDTFASFLLLDATHDDSLVYYDKDTQQYKWLYGGKVPFGLPDFPPDIDTNGIGHMVAQNSTSEGRTAIMDKMLRYRDAGGILTGYMDTSKIRLDPAMCANALTFFYSQNRGGDIPETEEWVLNVLRSRAFRDGTHYYPGPDLFLYFVSRLLKLPDLPLNTREKFGPILRDCVMERMGLEGDALALGFRVTTAARCGVCANDDLERLLALQEASGGWGAGVIYQFVRYKGLAFHRGVTAAIALLAMREWSLTRFKTERM